MKLKKLLKLLDPLSGVVIWGSDPAWDEPIFEGNVMDVPWKLANCPIGRAEEDAEEPMFINCYGTPENGRKPRWSNPDTPVLVVNIIED